MIQDIANNTSQPKAGMLAAAIGVLIALFGASGIFGAASGCFKHHLERKTEGESRHVGICPGTLLSKTDFFEIRKMEGAGMEHV